MISVIIPIYNRKQYLSRCVDSVLSQSYADFELLLIDDGSDDGAGELCDQLSLTDNRIRVFHQQNKGVSAARNNGLRQSKGEYIAFIDSDDYVDSNYFEELIKGIISGADVSVCATINEDEEQNFIRLENNVDSGLLKISDYNWNGNNARFMVWGAIIKRSVVDDILFDENLYVGEDTLFLASCIKKVNYLYYTNRTKYHYVVYQESTFHGLFNNKRLTEIAAWREIYRIFNTPDVAVQYGLRSIGFCKRHYLNREFRDHYLDNIIYEYRHIAGVLIKRTIQIGWLKETIIGIAFFLFPKWYLYLQNWHRFKFGE